MSSLRSIASVLAVIPSISAGEVNNLGSLCRALDACEGVTAVVMSNAHRLTAELNDAGIRHLTQGANAGFGSSVTYAANESAPWDWLLIVNDDVQVQPADLQKAVEEHLSLKASKTPQLVYFDEEEARQIPTRGDVVLQVSLIGGWLSKKLRSGRKPIHAYRSFSCVAISRQLWDLIGGFDPSLPFTYEDADLVRRAYQVGFSPVLASQSGVVHKHSVSSGQHVSAVLPVATYSGAVYLDKWYGKPVLNTMLLVSALFVRLFVVPFARPKKSSHIAGIAKAFSAVIRRRTCVPKLPLYGEI